MKPWSQLTESERAVRRKNYREKLEQERHEIAQRNAALTGRNSEWPAPSFLTPELERMVGRDMSERPLHGVPSIYRSEAQSITNIMLEQLQREAIALAVPRSRPTTFLSPADQKALKAKVMDPATSPAALREYRSRLSLHRPYRGG